MTLNFKQCCIAVVLSQFLSSSAMAANLMDAFKDALSQDPDFLAAAAERKANREALPSAIANLLPSIGLSANTIDSSDFSGIPEIGTYDSNSYNYGLSAQQTLIDFSKWHEVARSKHVADAADASFEAAYQDLIMRVATAYFAVLAAEDNLEFVVAEKKAVARQLEQIQQQYKVGLVAITDVSDSQAKHDTVVADELTAQNSLNDRREELRQITGQSYATLAALESKLQLLRPLPDKENDWVVIARENNPSLRYAEYTVKAFHSQLNEAKAGHLPVITAAGAQGEARLGTIFHPTMSPQKTWSYGLSFQLPLFAGGKVMSEVRKAQYDLDATEEILVKTARQTEASSRSTYRGVITNIGRAKALQQAVTSSEIALNATKAAYEVGTRTVVDVLDAISTLYQQQYSHAQARYNYLLGILALKQAAGVLTMDDVKMINKMLADDKRKNLEIKKEELEDADLKKESKNQVDVLEPKL